MRRAPATLVAVAASCVVVLAGCGSGSPAEPQPSSTPTGSASGTPSTSPTPAPTRSAAPPPTATLLAVGDVGDCSLRGDRGRASARLARKLTGSPILLLGDIAYPDGSRADYRQCFWPSWRPLQPRVRAVIGNHDNVSRSTFYATWPTAGTSSKPWYAFDVGTWEVLVVEGNCTSTGCGSDDPQTRWLARRLADAGDRCTLLAVHQPRFSSDDEHGDDPALDPLWRTAYRGGIDLVVAGHAHDYERIGPLAVDGARKPGGPVLLVVGTGGAHARSFVRPYTPASRVRIAGTFGLARLTLSPDGWRSQFLAAPSGAVRDTASGPCR